MKHRMLVTGSRVSAFALAALIGTFGTSHAGQPPAAPAPGVLPDSDIRSILVKRIDADKQSIGIVVGVVEPKGRRIVTYGRVAKGDERPLAADTVFEIGSVTKVFTSLVLADMVQRGEVSLDDPIAKFLPAGAKLPAGCGNMSANPRQYLTSNVLRVPRSYE